MVLPQPSVDTPGIACGATISFSASLAFSQPTSDYAYAPPQTSPPRAHAVTRFLRGSARVLHIFHSTYYTGYISY